MASESPRAGTSLNRPSKAGKPDPRSGFNIGPATPMRHRSLLLLLLAPLVCRAPPTLKYGAPATTTRSAIRSPAGFTETQEVSTWKTTPGVEMIFLKFSAQRDRSLLYVGNAADRALLGDKLE